MYSGVTGMLNWGKKIRGTVVLMRKNVLDFNSISSVTTGNVGGIIGTGLNVVGSTVDGLTASSLLVIPSLMVCFFFIFTFFVIIIFMLLFELVLFFC